MRGLFDFDFISKVGNSQLVVALVRNFQIKTCWICFKGNVFLGDIQRFCIWLQLLQIDHNFDLLFVIVSTMLLINLIIALLTSAYDEASNATSDELAMRQFRKLHEEGYSKLKRSFSSDSEEGSSFTERLDDAALIALSTMIAKIRDRLTMVQAYTYTTKQQIAEAADKAAEGMAKMTDKMTDAVADVGNMVADAGSKATRVVGFNAKHNDTVLEADETAPEPSSVPLVSNSN